MTEETRAEILKYADLNLQGMSKSLDGSCQLLKTLTTTNKFSFLPDSDINKIIDLLKFKMLLGIISLDLISVTRIYLQAHHQYEGIFSLRQFYVIINEGFKKVYNFENINLHGEINNKNRMNSFWVKKVGSIVRHHQEPAITAKYNQLTGRLDNYFKDHFNNIQDVRNLSIHYDEDLLKVYDMMIALNSESTIKKFMPFYQILLDLFAFIHEIMLSTAPLEIKQSLAPF